MATLRVVPDMYLISDYDHDLRSRGLATSTIHARLKFVAARLREWGSPAQPAHVIADFVARYTGWTRRTYHGHLLDFYDWLVRAGELEVNPVRDMKRPPAPKPRPRPLTPAEMSHALSQARGNTRAYLALGFYAGLRAHEVAKFRGEDITAVDLTVCGKGGQTACLPTHPQLWAIAQRYPRAGYWFPSPIRYGQPVTPDAVSHQIRVLFRALGIEGASHRSRHSFGSQLARSGAHLRVVQDLMRHSSLNTTQAYIAVDRDEKVAAITALSA